MRIAMIGCGHMGSGIARRLASEHSLDLYDIDFLRAQQLARDIFANAHERLEGAVNSAEIIMLAVKPQNLENAAMELNALLKPGQMLVSILAGTPVQSLQKYLPAFDQIARMMPNLAVTYGEGVIALAENPKLDPFHLLQLQSLCASLGKVYWVQEDQIDAVTSLAASGPAFFAVMIEAMTEAGIAMGFPAAFSQSIVMEMLKGTLTILFETGEHPAEFKWKVASPGGTTIAGLGMLEHESVRNGIIRAFLASYQRAKEISIDRNK